MCRRAESDFVQGAIRVAVTPASYRDVMKRCTKCGELKPKSEFYKVKGGRDGLRGDCKTCHAARAREWYAKNREHSIANVKRWQQANKERLQATRRKRNVLRKREIREGHLRRTFGITQAEYDAMLATQGGGCAICGDVPAEGKSLHVDHDHETGRVRGLLCFKCNGGLGQFGDDVDKLNIAIQYVARSDDLMDAIAGRARALRAA